MVDLHANYQMAYERLQDANEEIERLRDELEQVAILNAQNLVGHNRRIEELERENRWMAAKIGDKEYDAMREAMIGGEDE